MKHPITTHILYLHTGTPAAGVAVELYAPSPAPDHTSALTTGVTDGDGRITQWQHNFELSDGIWRVRFFTDEWFRNRGESSFYSDIEIAFKVDSGQTHYHVPLLLNAYGYSTYRGS